MRDARLRELERAWRQAPGDQEALARLIGAKRRAGEEVPGGLLDQQVQPAQTVAPGYRFDVYGDLPGEGVRDLGKTTRARGLNVPRHYALWVRPPRVGQSLDELVAAVRRQELQGLALDRSQVTTRDLERVLRDLPHLVWLSLAGCARISGLGFLRQLPQLRHLDLDRSARALRLEAGDLRALPELIHLGLRDRSGDREAELIAEHAPNLTRLRIGGGGLTNKGLERLGRLEQLTRLEVGYSGRVSSKGLGSLAGVPRLLHLDLVGCVRMKGPSLQILGKLPHLASLGYYPFGPWGMWRAIDGADLRGLRRLTRLQHLTALNAGAYQRGSALSEEEQDDLRRALPSCEVEFTQAFPEQWFLGPTDATVAGA